MAKLSELPRNTGNKALSDEIYDYLRDQIINGLIFQRERLVEETISKQLGVSRTPIREAIKRLQADGLVEKIPNKGAQIVSLSPKEIEESYQVVAVLEGYAAFLATPELASSDIDRLRRLNVKLADIKHQNDSRSFFEADKEFHSIYLDNCNNSKLLRIIDKELASIHRFRVMSHSITERLQTSVHQHDKIIEAFISKDPLAARHAIEDHILHGANILVDFLTKNKFFIS